MAVLPARHFALAFLVVAVWGSNFVVIKYGLAALPPFLFATLRFILVAFPALFFLRRPSVPWRNLAAYGFCIGAGQFGLLYLAMQGNISPGLASLVIQTQVVFTIGLAMAMGGERLKLYQVFAVLLAAAGILVIALKAQAAATPLGLGLVVAAAFSWGLGNQVARQNGRINALAFVVWSSPFSVPPLLLLSLLFEGPHAIAAGLASAGAATWAAVLWQSIGNTMFGYAAWAWLLSRHSAAAISPLALLVPVFGVATSALVLGEPLPAWKIEAALLVLMGLALNFFWPLLRVKLRAQAID
jgi:O-acetylserine/cysteine efflux transporter